MLQKLVTCVGTNLAKDSLTARERMQFMQLRRREFIELLGAAAACPCTAAAQSLQAVIGLVSIGASPTDPANFRPFLQQMAELGYADGRVRQPHKSGLAHEAQRGPRLTLGSEKNNCAGMSRTAGRRGSFAGQCYRSAFPLPRVSGGLHGRPRLYRTNGRGFSFFVDARGIPTDRQQGTMIAFNMAQPKYARCRNRS